MKTEMDMHGWAWLVLLVIMATAMTGCKTGFTPAGVPSDQRTPLVLNQESLEVLSKGLDKDSQVLASALESVQEGGSVVYVDHQGFVYDPEGRVVFGPEGNPLRLRTKIIAKLRSLDSLAGLEGVADLDYEIGGRSYLPDLPDHLKHIDTCPVPLRLRVKGVAGVTVDPQGAELRRAAGEERAAIFSGLSQLAEARGAAFATRVEALADGGVRIITATGEEIVGRVLGLTPFETGIEGAGHVVQALIETDDGGRYVIAEGDEAEALE